MHADYFKAAIPEPYRVFGVELLPLSLRRFQLLKRFDCAFVSESQEHTEATREGLQVTANDLLLGILVCSMPVKDFLELLSSDRWEPELARWGKHIEKEIEADPYFNLLAKFGLFQAYIDEATQMPRFWDEHPEVEGSGVHWSHGLEISLRTELGYKAEEIEEGPLSKALLDYFKYAENQGLVRLISSEEIEQGDANGERLLELLKGAPCLA